ncbi:NAD(P)H-binding protein [Thiorhodococcus minor]|uniref:NAD(P)H-binding protein n=1 Tax=Thiorhodococcus minor TaxID=57489 RepID=A0A6M0K859_9GAMM|nr:NAD(P)H-binding protein [Thiorhodococcus minor]NEV64585.1 NAD(P)H-binding protein [Thiorhodococcus minor]
MTESRTERPRVAIAGASGFVGTALLPHLAERFQVRALTRSPIRAASASGLASLDWRHCDLFRVSAVEHSLKGIDYAVYLVHSLAPSSRLTQASPRDMDLVLADNFARAAAANGVRQILFVSGVMPQSFRFSPLLWSRREVEMVLASQGTPVTALRPSLVLGPGGTGPNLLIDLVRRLPVLLLPPSSASRTRPIALPDLIRAILHCLGRPHDFTGAFDIGGREELSYEQMLRETAQVLGLRRLILRLPLLPTSLVSLTARLVSGAPPQMVGAIVESLPQDTLMRDNALQRVIAPDALSFAAALERCIDPVSGRPRPRPRDQLLEADQSLMRKEARVRSIQRVLLPPGQDATWVSGNYFRWLGSCCWPLIRSQVDGAGHVEVWIRLPRLKLLALRRLPDQSTPERQVYAICGGALARPGSAQARFEFHTLLGARYTMTAIHDYAPALPWYLYIPTQALGHWLVMRRYQGRLARLAR